MPPISNFLRWTGYLAVGVACLASFVAAMIGLFRCRTALRDLVEEVNSKIPYVMKHNIYSMNPLEPFRVWRQHKQFFHLDTGTRHRVKHYETVWIVSLLTFVSVILIWVFVGG